MAITNNLLPQVDLPVWEWSRFAPVTTTATSILTTARDGSSKYLYYLVGAQLYRHDTRTDTWQTLSVGGSVSTTLAAQYVSNQGFRGRVLSVPSSTSIQIPGIGTSPIGYKIKIIAGTGAGQERTITSTAAEVIHDSGLVTTVSTSALTDTTKKWKHNQWRGYGARVILGAGLGQSREILYNGIDTLQVFDLNYEGRDFMTSIYNANAPYGTFSTTAGAQNVFQIVSQVVDVDTAWDIQPDTTSRFRIDSDGIWVTAGATAAPFFTHFYYDILSDRWIQKLAASGLLAATLGTDIAIEPTTNIPGSLILSGSVTSSFATSLTSQSLANTTVSMSTGSFVGNVLRIESGSGQGQERRIIANTNNTFTLASKWDIMPTTASRYSVTSENAIYLAGNAASKLYKFYPEPSLWTQGNLLDSGWASQFSLIRTTDRINSFGVATATRVTNGALTINPVPTAAGSGYVVGDILTLSTGGANARVVVEAITATGAVQTLSLLTAGSGYSIATGQATTGGAGSSCTVSVTSLSAVVGVVTVPINHDFKLGETFTFAGATEAAWNQVCTVIGIAGAGTTGTFSTIIEVSFASTGPASTAASVYAQSTTTLVDASKNWIPNEHAGRILGVQPTATFSNNLFLSATAYRKIIGNTATTITFIAGTTPTNGNSRYFIQELEALGDAESYLADNQASYGYASSTSTTSSLVDPTKTWTLSGQLNQWAGTKLLLTDVSGSSMETIITSNSSSSLNIGRTVAVGAGTVNTIAYSDNDGVNWTGAGAAIFTTSGNAVCWSGTRFVAVGQGTNAIAWSNDGAFWNGIAAAAATFSTAGNGIAWNGTRFVAAGEGTNGVGYSNDGITWVMTPINTGNTFSTRGNAVAWSGTRFVAAGEGTNTLIYSTDGVTWAIATNTISTAAKAVCWGGNKFVAGGSGTATVATSADGITWVAGTTPLNFTQINGLAWSGTQFVAVGTTTGNNNCIAYSTDGASWTVVTNAVFTSGLGVAWNGVNFVATGIGSNTLQYSADGITWTTSPTATLFSTSGKGAASMSPFQSMVPNIGIVPANRVKYKIYDTTGTATGTQSTTQLQDLNKKWKVNQWAGSRLILTSGAGQQQEITITQNTSNILTWTTTNVTTPDATTTYTIVQKPVTTAGTQLLWNWGTTVAEDKADQLIMPRAGGYTFDIYDLRTNRWKVGQYVQGMGEFLGTGTMYTYDGKDRIYYTVTTTGRVFYYDIKKNQIQAIGTIPYAQSTALIGSRISIITTADGLQYLYIMRHTGQEMWRTLIFN